MKWFLVFTLLLTLQLVASKNAEKTNSKKASSAKPTKTPKTIVEHFTELPSDDLDFIKQLDKQFKLHGEKVKIKVERVNKTSTDAKNLKRTIDGDLGYGYYANQHNHGFYFAKPKFVYYRYSQPGQDIPPASHHNQQSYQSHGSHGTETVTDIQIQPSHGYELKDSNSYQNYQPHSQQQYYQQQHSSEPVIVLRIPGPQKYAAHLQTLLQQYLEIRAAQFVKQLEEQEHRGQHAPQTQALVQHQPQQQHIQHYAVAQSAPHYAPVAAPAGPVYASVSNQYSVVPTYHQAMYHTTVTHVQQPQYVYTQEAAHGDQKQHQQDDSAYQYEQPEAQQQYQQQGHDEQHYQSQVNEEQQYEDKPQVQDEQQYQQEAAPQYHQQATSQQYDQQQQYYSQSGQDDGQYERPQPQTVTKYIYETPPQTHGAATHSNKDESEELETYENYPSDTHTQVTFGNHYADSKNYGHHAEQLQQQYNTPDDITNYVTQATHSEVSITPKPYNYHAHPITAAPSSRSHSSKRDVPYSEEQFKKINKLINRLRKTKSIVEPKSD